MFLRGQIGPCPQWLADVDVSAETAAIEAGSRREKCCPGTTFRVVLPSTHRSLRASLRKKA
jgi:hypothetical protein